MRMFYCVNISVYFYWSLFQYFIFFVVIDLLEALNVTRSIKGVTKSKGLDPGSPAWKFRPRVPHLTLPWDYSVYLLSSTQGSVGLHFVAKQAKNNQGTLLAFLSPAAMKKDGHPLLHLVSDTQEDQLRLEYRTPQTMEPASLLLPGGSPFSGSKWARLALNIDTHKVTLFLDCEEPVIFGKEGEDELLSLILPLDLEISFASTPGNKESKFLVRVLLYPFIFNMFFILDFPDNYLQIEVVIYDKYDQTVLGCDIVCCASHFVAFRCSFAALGFIYFFRMLNRTLICTVQAVDLSYCFEQIYSIMFPLHKCPEDWVFFSD